MALALLGGIAATTVAILVLEVARRWQERRQVERVVKRPYIGRLM